MALLDRVAAHRASKVQAAADPVTLEEFGYLLGQANGLSVKTKAGLSISASRALAIPAWYSGVRHIAEVMAGLPVHRYRSTGDRRQRLARPQWMVAPDVEQTWYGLVEHLVVSLLHKGNGFAFKLRNPSGQVVGLRELFPDRITGGQAPDGTKRFMVDRDEDTVYTTRDVLHIPGLAYDGRFGLNPIRNAADALGAVAAADDYAQRFFGSGTHLGGVISVGKALSPKERADTQAEWEAFHAGLLNAHRTGVLSHGSTYNRLSLNAKDAQLIESRQYGVTEIARLLRLPPHKLYDLTRATFSNIEHQSIEAITDGIQPWCERIEAWINADRDLTPEGTFIKFELEGRLRGDTQTRYEGYGKATGGPWLTVNEARALEDKPPVDGGDDLLRPLNMGGGRGDARQLAEAAAGIVQKAYLGVVNNAITAREARELLVAIGVAIPPDFPGANE